MPLRLLEPPRTLPRGHWCTSPPLCCCGVVSYAQSTSVPQSAGHIGGWWMASSVSGPPASSTTTRAFASSESRAATAHPADPAPITTWSTCDDDMGSPLCFGPADTTVCAHVHDRRGPAHRGGGAARQRRPAPARPAPRGPRVAGPVARLPGGTERGDRPPRDRVLAL